VDVLTTIVTGTKAITVQQGHAGEDTVVGEVVIQPEPSVIAV